MRPILSSGALGALVLAASCFNPVNAVTYQRYFDAAQQAKDAGDLEQSKIYWSRAVINAQIGHLGPKAESSALYNYGLVVGQLCEFDNARDSFTRALELEEQAEGRDGGYSSKRIFELARLNYDYGKYAEAVQWYARGIPLARKLGADRGQPIAFADQLDDYATALAHTGDATQAAELRAESIEIRRLHPGATPEAPYMHYPTKCTAK